MPKCPHEGVWGPWVEWAEGVTHALEARDKTCVHCGEHMGRETRNGRKL